MSVSSCKKEESEPIVPKKRGCTDINSLNYDSSAEEDDGTCNYISGNYSVIEDCNGVIDSYVVTIVGDGSYLLFNNFGDNFDNISATRSGLSITIHHKYNIADRAGKIWDFNGGSGTISADGSTLIVSNFSIDDVLHGNQLGYIYCNATGIK